MNDSNPDSKRIFVALLIMHQNKRRISLILCCIQVMTVQDVSKVTRNMVLQREIKWTKNVDVKMKVTGLFGKMLIKEIKHGNLEMTKYHGS